MQKNGFALATMDSLNDHDDSLNGHCKNGGETGSDSTYDHDDVRRKF